MKKECDNIPNQIDEILIKDGVCFDLYGNEYEITKNEETEKGSWIIELTKKTKQ